MKEKDAVRVLNILREEAKQWNKPYVEEVKERTLDPFQVLVSCILSLRTKDEVTAKASRKLLSQADTPEKIVVMGEEEVARLIYPVGFYRVKARNLIRLCRILIESYNSRPPSEMEELLKLPGVGRKTAALVLSLGYGKPAICVDTHVHRITNRWGLVDTRHPHQTEEELKKKIPPSYWRMINSLLVAFGQTICRPLSPLCSKCPVKDYCSRKGVSHHR